jgi:hypothetical protein
MIGEHSITAIILNWRRYRNLPQIVSRLKRSETSLGIWIWNNQRDRRIRPVGIFDGCRIVNSSHNYLCPARHAFAMLCDSKYLLFVDDDILPEKSLPSVLLDISRRYRFSVIGVAGVRVNEHRPYTNPIHKCHSELYEIESVTRVDYVKGRMMFVAREHMRHLWHYEHKLSEAEFREDDIALNLSIQMVTGLPSYVLPGRLFQNLAGYDCGLHADWQSFSEKRDRTIDAFKRLGWRSLVGQRGTKDSNFGTIRRKRTP